MGLPREFRVRKMVALTRRYHKDDDSLAVAQVQEEWKHSIDPAQAIDQHPLAKSTRINIKYRHYRESLHPKSLSRCSCGIQLVFRCVQRKKTRGRYMWM
ncbi:hypothetical protein B0T26DRAFT_747080 [Lasiosphaeria miniovina]|uniref:Uncharacterized protein n=1 Tax=Lasiosphaeria miniovina TaxID=1954250 RepID=A0AA40BJF7_9PEZI|nr:uncharacterized protein B0T26DRAFT_747080 [Lasiosphaeria miniovina]KAK0735272.1 hypothetical protein B0T26DRAFT_747080 [Lasiosphaeria miniovina]